MKKIKIAMWITIIIGIVIFALIVSTIFFNVYMIYSYNVNMPFIQKNSKWISEDKRIEFIISEDGQGIGTFQINSTEKIDIQIIGRIAEPVLEICSNTGTDDLTQEHICEKWRGVYFGENKFIVTVSETTFYEKDQMIVFYKDKKQVTQGTVSVKPKEQG